MMREIRSDLLPRRMRALPTHFLPPPSLASNGTPARLRAGNSSDAQQLQNEFFPTLHVLGAAKAGSTSLHESLHQNGVCGCLVDDDVDICQNGKELSIWYSEAPSVALRNLTAEGYSSLFGPRAAGVACRAYADGTPTRLHTWYSANELGHLAAAAKATQKLRLIALLREPVARHLSWYNHRLTTPRLSKWSFWTSRQASCQPWFGALPGGHAPPHLALVRCEYEHWQSKGCQRSIGNATAECWIRSQQASSSPSWIEGGIYLPQLLLWQRRFPRGQLLVLQFEQTIREGVARALDFAGLGAPERVGEAVGGPSIMLPHNNSKPSQCKQSQVHCSVVRMLVPLYKPWNSLLLQQLHRDTATGKAPRQEPAFPEFPTPECIEVQEERPPVNLSLCTPV